MNRLIASILALGGLLLADGCATSAHVTAPPVTAAAVGELRPGMVKGYLQQAELPDSLALLPAPPAPGSPAQAADDAAFQELRKLLGTPRGNLAVADANIAFPTATFACALGAPISEQETPHLNMLLRRTLTDAALATYKAKNHYQRTRPFVAFKVGSCTPADEPILVKDGSYPSGHSAIGWSWALVLTQVAPDHADALLQRGRAFGQSRAICGAHWSSDVVSGRTIGAATVARLQGDAVFSAQLEAARAEVAHERSSHAVPAADCAAEAATIAGSSTLAP